VRGLSVGVIIDGRQTRAALLIGFKFKPSRTLSYAVSATSSALKGGGAVKRGMTQGVLRT